MAAAASRAAAGSPVRVTLADLLALKSAGESLRLASPRIRTVAVGGHLSPHKGRGVEFDESRLYQPGDDLRTMDWRVTARTGKPHTKVFREERNRPVFVWLDLRRPMLFATRGAFKAVRAAQIAGLVAWSAVSNGDRLGGLVFNEAGHRELRPALGLRAALKLFNEISAEALWTRAAQDGATLASPDHALLRLTRVARPGSLIFMLTDFRGFGDDAQLYVRELAGHCEVFIVQFYDPIEAELPPPGRYRIQAGARSFTIETADRAARERYRERFVERHDRLRALARLPGVHVIDCATNDEPRTVLARQFRNA